MRYNFDDLVTKTGERPQVQLVKNGPLHTMEKGPVALEMAAYTASVRMAKGTPEDIPIAYEACSELLRAMLPSVSEAEWAAMDSSVFWRLSSLAINGVLPDDVSAEGNAGSTATGKAARSPSSGTRKPSAKTPTKSGSGSKKAG